MRPILFQWGPVTLYTYGFFVALSALFSWFWLKRICRERKLDFSIASDLVVIIFLSGLAGARALYVATHISDYQGRMVDAINFQEGGLVWYGGLLAAVASSWVYLRLGRKPIFLWADVFAPVLLTAHGIGRLGCYFNGCCSGIHGWPVQLFEAAILFALSAWFSLKPKKEGVYGLLLCDYLIWYGSARFVLEWMRDQQVHYGYLTLPQWMSAGLLVAGILLRRWILQF